MRTPKLIVLVALALGFAACTDFGGVRTIRGDWTGYSLKYLQYAASKGSLPTMVSGSAFADAPQSAVAEQVRAELSQRPYGVGPIAFVPYPPGESTPPLFVSMVINPASSFDGWAACNPARAAASGGEPQPDGSLRVVAAFCSSQRLLSESVGYAEGLDGPADERFNHLIHLLAMDLFPLRDPNLGVGCDDCP